MNKSTITSVKTYKIQIEHQFEFSDKIKNDFEKYIYLKNSVLVNKWLINRKLF